MRASSDHDARIIGLQTHRTPVRFDRLVQVARVNCVSPSKRYESAVRVGIGVGAKGDLNLLGLHSPVAKTG
jgi:hypothetical protein